MPIVPQHNQVTGVCKPSNTVYTCVTMVKKTHDSVYKYQHLKHKGYWPVSKSCGSYDVLGLFWVLRAINL